LKSLKAVFISFCILSLLLSKLSYAGIIYENYGDSTAYNLKSGDSLIIHSGTYTGSIDGFSLGAKIHVATEAVFRPTGLNWSNVRGTIYVYGTFIMDKPEFRTNSNFTIYNYGIVDINFNTRMNGSNQLWFNSYGAVMNFFGDVLMNGVGDDNNKLVNHETVNYYGDFQMNAGSNVNNQKYFIGTGDLIVNGGTLRNDGKLETTGKIDINSGTSVVNNYCRLMASGGIYNSSGSLYNYSYIWAKNDLGMGTIGVSNGGKIYNRSALGSSPIIHGGDLDFTGGLITGFAYMYFYGYTENTGGFAAITGDTAAYTSDTIRIYEVTRTATPPDIYDRQEGIVAPNVKYSAWGAPDSTRESITGCSLDIFLTVLPLNITWAYFSVTLPEEFPLLNWSGEFDIGTDFEIQRSYDGVSFDAISRMPYKNGQPEYSFTDRLLNLKAPIAYYRIRAIQPGGEEKFTQIRSLKFAHQGETVLQIIPNPFKSTFYVTYYAEQNEMISIRMFNMSGQQQLVKNVPVNNGVNRISVPEAAALARGMYLIQINGENYNVRSAKILKQ